LGGSWSITDFSETITAPSKLTSVSSKRAGRPPDASPPVFEQIFRNARFAQGGHAVFEGVVKGNPTPQVTWSRKGAPLTASPKCHMTYDDRSGKVTLQISHIGPGDEGEYTCTASNVYGEAVCTVHIQPEAGLFNRERCV